MSSTDLQLQSEEKKETTYVSLGMRTIPLEMFTGIGGDVVDRLYQETQLDDDDENDESVCEPPARPEAFIRREAAEAAAKAAADDTSSTPIANVASER